MSKTGIFYGSTTGTTKDVAEKIAKIMAIPAADVHDVATTAPSAVGDYDNLIFGTSTWGSGELQDDWENFVAGVEVLDLKGKKIALFGCGDESMSQTFCNGVGELYRRLQKTGATFVGAYDAEGYDYEHTDADVDGTIVGLLIDDVNHPEMTDLRLRSWVGILEDEFNKG